MKTMFRLLIVTMMCFAFGAHAQELSDATSDELLEEIELRLDGSREGRYLKRNLRQLLRNSPTMVELRFRCSFGDLAISSYINEEHVSSKEIPAGGVFHSEYCEEQKVEFARDFSFVHGNTQVYTCSVVQGFLLVIRQDGNISIQDRNSYDSYATCREYAATINE